MTDVTAAPSPETLADAARVLRDAASRQQTKAQFLRETTANRRDDLVDDAESEAKALSTVAAWLESQKQRVWRHVKRGTLYTEIGRAELQDATGSVVEGCSLVVYRGTDGRLWARQEDEFEDGRFEAAASPEILDGTAPPTEAVVSFQVRVDRWIQHCFGPEIGADKVERNHRFIEEALELVQSGGCTASEAHQLVDYVFGRPVGEMHQEVGGVMNTLATLCNAYGVDLNGAAETELARVWAKSDQIRAKRAAKPKHSPLPEN